MQLSDDRPGPSSSRALAASHEPSWEDLERTGILGPGTTLTGRLSFSGRVRIEGVVEGDVLGGELLIVAGTAVVRGSLRARTVVVLGGTVEGDIRADVAIELRVPAIVTGDLEAPQIFLDRGVQFVGRCQMHPLPDE